MQIVNSIACRMLEQKLTEAKSKKNTLKARAKSAQTTRQINDMIQGLNLNNSMAAFERMEEKVMALESESEATLQVKLTPKLARQCNACHKMATCVLTQLEEPSVQMFHLACCVQLAASDNLEDKFKKLEGNDVDDELAQLKRGQLKSGTSSAPRQSLPEGRPIRYLHLLWL